MNRTEPAGDPQRQAVRPTRRRPRGAWLVDRLRGLLSLLVILALLVGMPAALLALRGNPLPDSGLDLGALLTSLTRPDDGSLFLGAVTWVSWAGWAGFAVSVGVETVAQMRGLPSPHLPAFGGPQRAAGALVTAAALLFSTPLPAGSALAAQAPVAVSAAASLDAAQVPAVVPVTTLPPGTRTSAAPNVPAGPTYTVRPGDSLWQIAADRLGDGARYPEVARLNYGVSQDDGRTLTDDHWLRTGWELTLPADATTPPAGSHTVVVEPGDTLWAIAAEALGDGDRYPEIAALSDAVQDDGARLVDPDLIRPGWELTVPGAPQPGPTTPAPPVPATRPSSATPDLPIPTSPPRAAPAPSPAAVGQSAPQDVDNPDSDVTAAVLTTGGIGALLASGLLVLLGTKRWRQQRARRPGERIAMPPADLAPAELDLRLVEDPAGAGRVDQALRTLSALLGQAGGVLPGLRLARLTGQDLELYLVHPVTLPAPFVATGDPTVWTVAGDAALLSAAELTQVPAPYPSLITLGHDLDGAHLLVDLEQIGDLAVAGDLDASLAILAGIATDLATSTWADDLQVTLVGCLPKLPAALGNGRVRHLPDLSELLPALERRAADLRVVLAAHSLRDLHHARTGTAGQRRADAWTPEIVLLAGPVSPQDQERLDAVLHDVPRVGLAAVTAAGTSPDRPSEWMLTLDPDDPGADAVAVLSPLGLALRPQRLTDVDLDQLLALLAVADLPATTATPAPQASAPALVAPGPPAVPVTDAAVTSAQPDSAPEDRARPDDAELTPAPGPSGCPPPVVQLLGPVELLRPRGTVESSKQRQLTEIAAYLSLHPGLDHAHLSEAIWPGARVVENTRNTALSKLRKWLGTDPAGVHYVPSVLTDGYRLHPDVRSDWQLWQELLPAGPLVADTASLAAALELVKGRPLAGTNPRRYAWAEVVRQDMISAVVDVAHELGERALSAGDATLARSAAAAGLQADPGAELLWRDALRAEWLAGDITGLTSTADRLSALSDELGDDLETETVELLEELLHRPRHPAGTGNPR